MLQQARAGEGTSANRYLKSPKMPRTFSPSLSQSLELAHIDFLTFTVDLRAVASDAGTALLDSMLSDLAREADQANEAARSRLCQWVFDSFLEDNAPELLLDDELKGFKSFFQHHRLIKTTYGEICGFVALGGEGQKGKICVELTGIGCTHVRGWVQLQAKLAEMQVRITRVDVAHDDYEGQFGIADAVTWYNEGLFTSRGRPPALQHQGWNDDSGRTLYVGKNTHNQQLCVYEKGKQQGDSQSKWIRWEGRFGSKYREIPHEILINPAAYLIGHFPALAWINCKSSRMDTSKARAEANLTSALKHFKRQNGAFLNLLKKHSPNREAFWALVEAQVRPRLPVWAQSVPAADEAFFEAVSAIYLTTTTTITTTTT